MVQGCEKIAQIFNVKFKFAAVRLAVALYSPVHFNGLRGPDADTAVKDLRNHTHTHTHTHTHKYIYIYIE
jgi:hypothetical protein